MIELTPMTTNEMIGVGGAILQFSALVWGAAKMSAKMDTMTSDVHEIKESVTKLADTQVRHEADIAVLKMRTGVYSK